MSVELLVANAQVAPANQSASKIPRLDIEATLELQPLRLQPKHNKTITTATMAEGGIDRKAEERMEFTTSKDVQVRLAPTEKGLLLVYPWDLYFLQILLPNYFEDAS